MAFTQDQLDALEYAIASGAQSVTYEGKSTVFRSMQDMLYARMIMRQALGIIPAASATVLAGHDRGYPGYGGTYGASGGGWTGF